MILAGIIALGAYLLAGFAQSTAIPSSFFPYALFLVAVSGIAHVTVRRFAPSADPLLLPIALVLAGIGFAMVRRLDPKLAGPQMLWIAVGAAAFCATLVLLRDHRKLEQFRYSLMLLGVALLLMPLVPGLGKTIRGARIWISFAGVTFQPAEAAKIVLAAFLAGYLASKREVMTVATARIGPVRFPAPRHFGPLLVAWVLSLAVLVSQSDLGSSVLFLSLFIVTMYVATSQIAYVLAGTGMFLGGAYFAYLSFAHVHSRIGAWLNPWAHINTSGFQIAQSLFALGSGGIGGTGIGRGRPDFIKFGVPTDFIFSAIGEELGLIGTVGILLLFAVIVGRGFHIATRSRDQFGTLLAVGLTSIIGIQTFLIVGGVTRLIPLTGITLPFISYGGSSIVSNFILIALLLRISDSEPASAMELAA